MIERKVSTAITGEQVRHVAKSSKLSFSEEELVDFANQLDKIIDMMELLEKVDTIGVPFTPNMDESVNAMREDVATPGMNRKELVWNVPESKSGYIKVPAITDSGGAGAQWKNYTTNH